MVGKKEILDLLQGRQLSAKDIANILDLPIRSVYRYLNALVIDGFITKIQKTVEGRSVTLYSLPVVSPGICQWEAHKEVLLTGKTHRKIVLEADFWPSLKDDILKLESKQENRHIAVVGPVGWGKSTTAISLARLLDSSFGIGDIVFTKQQLLRLVAGQPKNKSFVLDDVGVMLSSRQWQEKEREFIFNFLEICRMNRVNTIATAPSLAMIDVNYQRLLHYVFQIESKCREHLHIIVFKPTIAGLKPSFKPVGVLVFPYLESVDSIVKQYQAIKQEQLSLSARESLERFNKAKKGVRKYIWEHPVVGVTNDVVRSALHSIGLDGILSKEDKDRLRVLMYDTLEEKKKKEREVKKRQAEQLKKNKLLASYKSKYQDYIDQGRTEQFARTLAHRLTFEKAKAGNLKNLPKLTGPLFKKVKPDLVERVILDRLDDVYLVTYLRVLRDILACFKQFDKRFYSKLFAMCLYNPKEAAEFVHRAKEMRGWSQYRYHGRFSPKRWREGVEAYLARLEAQERRGNLVTAVFKLGVGIYGLATKQPGLISELEQGKKPFWGDV